MSNTSLPQRNNVDSGWSVTIIVRKQVARSICCLVSQYQEIVTLTFITKGFASSQAPITKVIKIFHSFAALTHNYFSTHS